MSPPHPTSPPDEQIETRLEFERLISDLSTGFVDLPADEVDSRIEDAQGRVCEFLGVDRSVVWQWSNAGPAVLTPTHIFFAEGAPRSDISPNQQLFPWIAGEMLAGRRVVASTPEELPPEAVVDRTNAPRVGVQSALILPLSVRGEPPVGALSFTTVRSSRDWPDALVKRLELVAQIFTGALLRKRYELRLEERDARLAAAADLAGLGFYEVDDGELVTHVDDRARAILGIPPDRQLGGQAVQFWMEHLHPDDRERMADMHMGLNDGRLDQVSVEYRYLHPAGDQTWLHHVAKVTRRDASGRAIRTFGVLRDVTERRQREEALRQSLAEIERLKDRLQAESDYLKAEIRVIHPQGEITGRSAAIQDVLRLVEQVAPTGSSVLLWGETGSGKELVAEAIHRLSPRRSRVMVKVNCAALPSGLVESELFGRERGAFTGALTRQAGRFEVADGSTLFLDEIGELSLEVQTKLLRVLETGEFQRLGSPRTIKVDVRVIAATNRDLVEEIRQRRFREDLYYRLNVFPIRVPPLRERPEDIPLLVWTFLEELCSRMGKRITQIPRKTMEALQGRRWPGNVRELRNVIEHAAILTTGETLMVPEAELDAPAGAKPPTLDETERQAILRALEAAGWQLKGPKGAARALGLHPSTLYTRMKKLGLWPRPPREGSSA